MKINEKKINRNKLFKLIDGAIGLREYEFARKSILSWLHLFPGDLYAGFLYSRILIAIDKKARALNILQGLYEADPEFYDALNLLYHCKHLIGTPIENDLDLPTTLWVLGKKDIRSSEIIHWGETVQSARQFRESGDLELAKKTIGILDEENPQPSAIAALTKLEIESLTDYQDVGKIKNLAEGYSTKWPNCLQIKLILAHLLMDTDDQTRAVALLNQAVASDVNGQVARRLWGANHRYRPMWPDNLEIKFDVPIPDTILSSIGFEHLPEGTNNRVFLLDNGLAGQNTPPVEITPQIQLDIVEEKGKSAAVIGNEKTNGRIPVYTIFSVRASLIKKYGNDSTAEIEKEMQRITQFIQQIPGWEARMFFADDANVSQSLNISLAKAGDAWSLKLFISDIEKALNMKGQKIGALLIVGGPDIVPFHHLPNPVNDPDQKITSDNPYGSLDENYFVPDWPVGRIPDDSQPTQGILADPGYLLKNLRRIADNHKPGKTAKTWYNSWLRGFRFWFSGRTDFASDNYGYSAAVWKEASSIVFRPIGNRKKLFISPPYGMDPNSPDSIPRGAKLIKRIFKKAISLTNSPPKLNGKLAYFNLHGLQDAIEWYGQKDPLDPGSSPDYPVALRGEDIPENNAARSTSLPSIVFTEACYGANIKGKTYQQALAFKFLNAGCEVFIGSTSMAYGSVNAPLIAADFLGNSFWNFLREGFPAGEALLRARIHLAQTMHNRQGYLDGEDQKTLISFIFLGDPLFQPKQESIRPKAPLRPVETIKEFRTISDSEDTVDIPPEIVSHVKTIVARYLPGMADAKCVYDPENDEIICALSKELPVFMSHRKKITLSKQIESSNQIHNQVARLTFDDTGKLVKLVVSR